MNKFQLEEKDIEDANGKDAFNVSYYFTKEYKRRHNACIKELWRTFETKREYKRLDKCGDETSSK